MRLHLIGLLLSSLFWSHVLAATPAAAAPPNVVTVKYGRVLPLPGKSASPADVAAFLYADTTSGLETLEDSASIGRIYTSSLLLAFQNARKERLSYPDARIGEDEWGLASFDIQVVDQTTILAHLVSGEKATLTERLHFVREDDEWKVSDIEYLSGLWGSLRWEIDSVSKTGDLSGMPLPHGLYDDGDGCGAAEITSRGTSGDADFVSFFNVPRVIGDACIVRKLSRRGQEIDFESSCEEGFGSANHTWKVRSSINLMGPTAFRIENRTYRFCGSQREPSRYVGETLPLVAGLYSRPGGPCGGIAYYQNPNASRLGSTFGGSDMQRSSCSPDQVGRDGDKVFFTTSCVPDDGANMDVNRERKIDLHSSTAFRFQDTEYKLCKRIVYDAPVQGKGSGAASYTMRPQAFPITVGYDHRTNQFGGEDLVAYTHNGSYVMVYPKHGVIAYYQPRPSMKGVAQEGDVIFKGSFSGHTIVGTAYLFKKGCPPIGYPVRGGSFGEGMIVFTLRGRAPVHAKGSCEIVGTTATGTNASLVFEPGSGEPD